MNDKQRKILALVLYFILSSIFIIFLPKLIIGNNDFLKQILSGVWVKVIQGFLFLLNLGFIGIVIITKGAAFENIGSGPSKSKRKQVNKYGDQGSAKEGNLNDLKDLTGNDGFTISKNVRLSSNASYEHVLVLGPTGSGKSSSFFIPNLLDMDGSHSVVVTDPKGEIHQKTKSYLQGLGYKVIKLSPLDLVNNDMYYNPLYIAKTDTEIRKIAQNIMVNGNKSMEIATGSSGGGSEWLNMATPLLAATLIYVKEFGEKQTISEALDIILTHNLEELENKFSNSPGALRSFLIFKSSAGSEKTLSSIKSVLTTNMQLFIDDYVEEFTKTAFITNIFNESTPDKTKMFDPLIIREQPTALFICVEETEATYMMPLMSILYTQILEKCMSNSGYPILFYLDEFANIGIIDGMPSIAATARSREVGISIGLQGVEQLDRNYGEKNAQDILNNLKTKLVFASLTGDSAAYVSELTGVTTVETKNVSNDPNSNSFFGQQNIAKSGVRRELFTQDEIRRMDKDDVLIIAHNKDVVKDTRNTYYTQKKYTNKLDD